MLKDKSFDEMAFDAIPEMVDYRRVVNKHNEELNVKAQEMAEKIANQSFELMKDEYRHKVIQEITDENLAKKGAEISISPYISKTAVVVGKELTGKDFVPYTLVRDPDYNGDKLCFNDHLQVWQKRSRNDGLKFVSNFFVTVIAIVNASGLGQCEALVVCLQRVEKPLIFNEGKIACSTLKQQTPFCKRGVGTNDKDYYDSFVRAMMMCPNVFFLSIPKHSGGNLLHGGIYDYTSKASIIPGLEMLYPKEIQQHQLMQHDRKFEEVTADYRENLPAFLQAKLAVTIRVMSILLPFFESEGLRPDRFFVCSVSDEKGKTAMSVLLSRFDYNTPVVTSTSGRITKVREMLSIGNDMTAIFTYSACENNMRAFQNALSELRRFISNETGFDAVTRKVIVLVTDVPGGIPEEYPVYYLSFAEDVVGVDIQKLQCLSGEFDYSLIQFLTNNPDAAKTLIRQSLDEAKELITHVEGTEHTDTMTMIIAVSGILEKIGIFSESDQQAFLNWFRTEADSRMTITEDICQRFQTAVSDSILKQDLRVAKQFGPPYYADDRQTAFIADTDGSINFSDDVLRRGILPQIPIVKNIAQLNKHLIEKGWLISTHTNKRQLKVTFESGVQEQVDVFSYHRKVMNAEARDFADHMICGEFWFDIGAIPENFVPVLCNADSSKVAGYVLTEDMDENRHEAFFGISRSGKSYALLQTALMRAERGEKVLIFDQSGSFTKSELEKHLGKNMFLKFFGLWDVYRDGLPVDLISIQGCHSYKEKKELITRAYALLVRKIGTYEETVLNTAVKKMLKDHKNEQNFELSDVVKYIRDDTDAYGKEIKDDAHRNLIYKLEEMLDDLCEAPITKRIWSDFVNEQAKPIIVISTGSDNVGKGSELVDAMLESLYRFKQQYPNKQYTVIIDEVQDLCLHEKGSVNTLLRKIGKSSTSMLLASQAFPDSNTALGMVMGNCGRIRGYRPKANDVMLSAKFFGCEGREIDALHQGECIDKGAFYSRYQGRNVTTTLKGFTIRYEEISKQK